MSDDSITAGNNTNSLSSPTDGDEDFSFKYTESGGLTSRYLLISFESKTNTLRLLILVAAIYLINIYLIQINKN